jgi:hypothetical protein
VDGLIEILRHLADCYPARFRFISESIATAATRTAPKTIPCHSEEKREMIKTFFIRPMHSDPNPRPSFRRAFAPSFLQPLRLDHGYRRYWDRQ